MWGAIIGDLAGSIYEYQQYQRCEQLDIKHCLITPNSFYSDDTILTIAILDAVLNDFDYEKYLRLYGQAYLDYTPSFENHFKSPFSPGFIKWLNNNHSGTSIGNGAMMRIAPIAYLFNTEQEVINHTLLATKPSHNSKESIECATKIAQTIFLARKQYTKEDILKTLNITLQYDPFSTFNSTCYETIGNCLYAAFTSHSFEESIYKVLSYGGDTDTNACITGSIAEALYGINKKLINEAQEKLPSPFVKKLTTGYTKIIN